MKQKFTSTIAGASIFISVLGLLSRGLGFLREMMFAGYFGLEAGFDLYLVGAVLPITINSIILYLGQNFFVPGFQKVNSSNPEESQKYFSQSFILFVGVGIIVTLLLFLFSDLVINLYMHSATLESRGIANQIFRIFILTIPFSAGISILSAYLQTIFEFKYPAISLLFLNISIIILIFLLADRIGVSVIPIGYVLGIFLQFFYLIIKCKKIFKLNLLLQVKEFSFLKSIIGPSLLIILLIESISQLYSIFDRYFFGYISPGGIASLNYAYIIFFLPISIFSISLATAVFPKITYSINNPLGSDIERIYNESISISIFIFMPLTFLMFYFGDTLIKLAFERGKFLEESTIITFGALRYYSLGLVFYSAYAVLNKILYSINLAKLLLKITVIGIILKLIVNLLLVKNYQQDGLAISTSISYFFFFIASYLVLNIKLKIKNKSLFVKEFILHFINCFISLIAINIISDILFTSYIIKEITSIIIFVLLCLSNLFLMNQKAIIILHQIFQRLNLKHIIKSV